MSIENLTQKILSEAENAAQSSLNNAKDHGTSIINEAKAKAEEIIKDATEKAQKDAEVLKSRKVSSGELQSRKMLLEAKQQVINKSFDKALDILKQMPEEKYINFLADEIVEIPDCKGILILNEKDRNAIGGKLISAVNDRLKEEKLKLGEKTIQAGGGFILKNGNIEINSTFETLLGSIKDGLTFEVANVLFN